MPPKLPKHLRMPGFVERWATILSHNLNFYRVHMLCFTFIPLIFAGVFYAANTEIHIPFLDCLFVCVSCMCVTGLVTIDLSTLSPFQQVLLYIQMLIGSTMFVSIIMVSVRKHFFRERFRHVLKERDQQRTALRLAKTLSRLPQSQPINTLRRRFTRRPEEPEEKEADKEVPASGTTTPTRKKKGKFKVSKDMIKRVDGGGVGMVNPMGWYDAATPAVTPTDRSTPDTIESESDLRGRSRSRNGDPGLEMHRMDRIGSSESDDSVDMNGGSPPIRYTSITMSDGSKEEAELRHVRSSESGVKRGLTVPDASHPMPYGGRPAGEDNFPRSKTIAFDEPDNDGFDHELFGHRDTNQFTREHTYGSGHSGPGLPRAMTGGSNGFPRTYSIRRQPSRQVDTKLRGYGGFPTPFQIVRKAADTLFPQATNKLTQTLTMPRTNTITGSVLGAEDATNVPYISFSAVVGRNSNFQGLTEEQLDELGGVEYRALKVLFWIVFSYWIFMPLAGATIIAPYIAANNRYDHVFNAQPRHVRIPLFAFFQATSAFSNTGTSLVDQSMVPFQDAYLMIVIIMLLIFMGNTCFPIMLRFIIWVGSKCVPVGSHTRESLQFLLDHPRRCFIYLFPSTHTWFLFIVVISLTAIDFLSFMVLDKGTPAIEEIPVGTRIAAGLFQSTAVRAAGFGIVPMNSLAPAVKVLYVIMMYISVYPIAMSVRATNVYEERSLGLFEGGDESDEEEEEEMEGGKNHGPQAVAKYLGWHARRQLAFDIWWIALALWLLCIIERGPLNNPENYEWMNVFNIVFELVSAYGTVGLSLGLPYDNYSLSGGFRKLSKLVIIVVMIRGRHRGLPVAIDRAVLLPKDFTAEEERALDERLRRSRSRRASMSETGSNYPRSYTTGSAFPSNGTGKEDPNILGRRYTNEPRPANMERGRSPPASAAVPPSPRFGVPRRRDSSPTVTTGNPLRRDTSPSVSIVTPSVTIGPAATRKHSRSQSQSSDGTMPPTPSALQFAIQRNIERTGGVPAAGNLQPHDHHDYSEETPKAPQGPSAAFGNTGVLTPVHESGMSRRPTITGEQEVPLEGLRSRHLAREQANARQNEDDSALEIV